MRGKLFLTASLLAALLTFLLSPATALAWPLRNLPAAYPNYNLIAYQNAARMAFYQNAMRAAMYQNAMRTAMYQNAMRATAYQYALQRGYAPGPFPTVSPTLGSPLPMGLMGIPNAVPFIGGRFMQPFGRVDLGPQLDDGGNPVPN